MEQWELFMDHNLMEIFFHPKFEEFVLKNEMTLRFYHEPEPEPPCCYQAYDDVSWLHDSNTEERKLEEEGGRIRGCKRRVSIWEE